VSTGVALAQFAATGLVALVVLAVLGLGALRSATEHEALLQAADLTSAEAESVVEPLLTDSLLRGDPGAVAKLDGVVREQVLSRRVVRVKLWDASGRIVYSDDRRLVGRVFPLDADDVATLRTGRVSADVSDLSAAENEFERLPDGTGQLLQVYTRVRTDGGTPLLFEMYLPSEQMAAAIDNIGRSVMPAFLPALLALEALQIPLAWRLVRRIRQGQKEREALHQLSLDARDHERRRIARDLHDGVVQSLAGVSYSLTAVSQWLSSDQLTSDRTLGCAEQVRSAARTTQGNLAELRTLIADIYPPTFHELGLRAAIEEMLGEATTHGMDATVDAVAVLDLDDETAGMVFRAAKEALRNVVKHSAAQRVRVRLDQGRGRITLVVQDDGVGLPDGERPPPSGQHHFGLRLLGEMAAEAGGRLSVSSPPEGGTTFVFELPAS
jgi:two-component system NarL family sensor kinase